MPSGMLANSVQVGCSAWLGANSVADVSLCWLHLSRPSLSIGSSSDCIKSGGAVLPEDLQYLIGHTPVCPVLRCLLSFAEYLSDFMITLWG